jgi:hypothetical protein
MSGVSRYERAVDRIHGATERSLQALGEQVRREVIRPFCKQHGLEFVSRNALGLPLVPTFRRAGTIPSDPDYIEIRAPHEEAARGTRQERSSSDPGPLLRSKFRDIFEILELLVQPELGLTLSCYVGNVLQRKAVRSRKKTRTARKRARGTS